MAIFALLALTLLCMNMAVYCVNRKRVDEQLKALEKHILKEFDIKDK